MSQLSRDRVLKIVLAAVVLLLVIGAALFFLKKRGTALLGNSRPNESSQPAQIIQADFIDLDKIFAISKFRSGSGHDFSKGSGESCRSMKHYFNPQFNQKAEELKASNNGIPPAPDGQTDISIYSPVDGTITGIASEKTPIGEQIYIRPDSQPSYTVRIFHVFKSAGIAKNTKVKAGQKIGVIGQYSSTDIAIMRGRSTYISYFDVMPDNIFAKYQTRGMANRSQIIISKAQRDANPLECRGEQFAKNYDSDPGFGNYVFLSGYLGETGSNSNNNTSPTNTPAASTPTAAPTESTSSQTNGSRSGAGTGGGTGAGTGGGTGSGRQ